MWYHTQRAIEGPCTFSQGFLSKIVYSLTFLVPTFQLIFSPPYFFPTLLLSFSPSQPLSCFPVGYILSMELWLSSFKSSKYLQHELCVECTQDFNSFLPLSFPSPLLFLPTFLHLGLLAFFFTHISFFVLNTHFQTFQHKNYY